jgi:hypothetical protein
LSFFIGNSEFGAISGSGEAVYVFVGNVIGNGVYEGVVDGTKGEGLGGVVAVKVGIGVAIPQATNTITIGIIKI